MNTSEYIESGILEAYALGALSVDEAQQVAANVAMYPELAKELAEIEATMLVFAGRFAMDIPKGLDAKIWAALQFTKSANAGNGHTIPKTIPFQPEYRKPARWRYAAVWVGLVGSLALNGALWMHEQNHRSEVVALNGKVVSMEQSQKELASRLSEYQKNTSMMADTDMQTIVMHTLVPGHPMAATLYWSKNKGEAYVTIDGLPAPPKGMQYQLWVMQNGKPVDMGVLPNSMANTPAMQKVAMPLNDGQAFAISLEKEGGSPTPTMQNIYVMGKPS